MIYIILHIMIEAINTIIVIYYNLNHIILYNHHPFKVGGCSKCKLAIRRCFGGGRMKMYAYIVFSSSLLQDCILIGS